MANLALYRLLVVMIGSLLTICGAAQLQLKFEPAAGEDQQVINNLNLKTTFKSAKELQEYVQQIPSILQAKGYLSASVDSIANSNNGITAHLFLGRQYHWKNLRIEKQDSILLTMLGYSPAKLNPSVISALPGSIIAFYQNNGYPFVKVKWDSITLEHEKISATLSVDKGPLYKMDSIGLYGAAKVSRNFLTNYLNLPADGIYRQNVFDAIDQRLMELPYLEQSQPWSITMQSSGYVLNFYLQPKRSNTVDALIGLLPSNQQNAGKLLLTADVKLVLQNAFGSGELIDFNWEQIQPKSPRLFLIYNQPYIFNSRFGLDAGFQLYKKDSSFLNIHGEAGLRYKVGDKQTLSIILQTQRTNLLDVDTTSIKFSRRLPDVVDLGITNLGFNYSYLNTDYRFNPRKGTEISLTTTAGRKVIRKNNAISNIKDGSFNFNSLYDSVQMNSYQIRLRVNAAKYFPLGRQAVFKSGLQAGFIQTPDYFRNEMFQVGGYRLLRGFDEESIFAARFAVASLEYRYLVGLNSFFFGFTDLGWTNFRSAQDRISHTYIGFGAGMSFQTKQGIFNISYAVGKRDDLRLDLRQSKIHFGYVSFF